MFFVRPAYAKTFCAPSTSASAMAETVHDQATGLRQRPLHPAVDRVRGQTPSNRFGQEHNTGRSSNDDGREVSNGTSPVAQSTAERSSRSSQQPSLSTLQVPPHMSVEGQHAMDDKLLSNLTPRTRQAVLSGMSPRALREYARGKARQMVLGDSSKSLRDAMAAELAKPVRVMWRDKLAFWLSVMSMMATQYCLLARPHLFWAWFSLLSVPLMAWRYITFTRRKWGFFLVDFCYAANLLAAAHVWVAPRDPYLFEATFMLANGPVLWAVLAWRNSMVFHDPEKMTSVFIHVIPALLTFAQRWHYPAALNGRPQELPPYLSCVSLSDAGKHHSHWLWSGAVAVSPYPLPRSFKDLGGQLDAGIQAVGSGLGAVGSQLQHGLQHGWAATHGGAGSSRNLGQGPVLPTSDEWHWRGAAAAGRIGASYADIVSGSGSGGTGTAQQEGSAGAGPGGPGIGQVTGHSGGGIEHDPRGWHSGYGGLLGWAYSHIAASGWADGLGDWTAYAGQGYGPGASAGPTTVGTEQPSVPPTGKSGAWEAPLVRAFDALSRALGFDGSSGSSGAGADGPGRGHGQGTKQASQENAALERKQRAAQAAVLAAETTAEMGRPLSRDGLSSMAASRFTTCNGSYWRVMGLPVLLYTLWQICYLVYTELVHRQTLAQDPSIITSLRWLAKSKGGMAGFVLACSRKTRILGPHEELDSEDWRTKMLFVLVQLTYTLLTLAPTKLLYDHYYAHAALLLFVVSASIWQGGAYYIEDFSTKYTVRLARAADRMQSSQGQGQRSASAGPGSRGGSDALTGPAATAVGAGGPREQGGRAGASGTQAGQEGRDRPSAAASSAAAAGRSPLAGPALGPASSPPQEAGMAASGTGQQVRDHSQYLQDSRMSGLALHGRSVDSEHSTATDTETGSVGASTIGSAAGSLDGHSGLNGLNGNGAARGLAGADPSSTLDSAAVLLGAITGNAPLPGRS